MSLKNDFNKQAGDLERENRRRERQKKWDERGKRFWRTFLFTENGKPKSGFLIYTFCLSVVFIALYLAAFTYIVDWLAPLTESWPVLLGNLTASLCVSAVVLLAGFLLHRVLSDKRLMLGTYMWLLLYVAASVIAMALLLKDREAMGIFLQFALWFALIPVCLGLVLFYLLYRRDYRPETPVPEEPAWKKYVRRS
jgi:hypothetical protein